VIPGAAAREAFDAEVAAPQQAVPQEAGPKQNRAAPRVLPVALVVLALALIGYGISLLVQGQGRTHTVPTLSTTTRVLVPTPVPATPKPTPQQLARAAAVKLAAKLPVSLESAALLRVGGTLYVVGGKSRNGGKPTDAVLAVDLATGKVRSGDHFIEPLADAGSATQAGSLYVAGGWTGAKAATAVLRWSPGKATALVARLPVALRSASAAFAGGRLFVTGGSPRVVFAVDVNSGAVVRAAVPPALRNASSNLDYLTRSEALR
jgi:hypothetical protein